MSGWWLLPAVDALAFDVGFPPPGITEQYRMEPGGFTATEQTQIDSAAAAWSAGPGDVLRGAYWHWTRGADVTTGATANFRDEVYERSHTWFLDRGIGTAAAAVTWVTPAVDEDIATNAYYVWCTDTPSSCTSGTSLGQTMVHEFGHRMNFFHENDYIATMNINVPSGGDISNTKYRINEDDSAGLQWLSPHSSTGINLMLSKFGYTYLGNSEELWDGATWHYYKSTASFSDTPTDILALIEGTSGAAPTIEWRVALASDAACFDGVGTEYTVGTLTPFLAVNVPFAVSPSGWNFAGVPTGTYRLCAKINPSGAISETSTVDNNVRSETYLLVEP
ncbi:MAG: hypothetical protein ABMB14_38950 [Myxococcota bacterium]